MTAKRFLKSSEAKLAGWFSCRHETSDANREARERYFYTRGKEARQRRAKEREDAQATEGKGAS